MKKAVVILLTVFLFVSHPVFAFATEVEEYPGEDLAEKLLDETPSAVKQLSDKLGIDEITPETIMQLNPMDLISLIIEQIKIYMLSPLTCVCAVFAITVFCAVVEAVKPNDNKMLNETFFTISSLAVSVVLLSSVIDCINKACTVVEDFSSFMLGYVPIFASTLTASGYANSAGAYSAVMFLVCQAVSKAASNVLLPMLAAYLAVSIIGGINPSLKLNIIADGFKSCVNKTLGFSLTVFVGMMSLQTLVTVGSDNVAIKAGKYLIGNFVPVVGSAISEVFLSVQGYMKLMKNCIGWYGVIAVILLFLPIVIEILVWKAAVYFLQIASQMLDVKNITATMNGFGSVLTMLMAILLTFALLLIVTTAIMLVAGTG